MYLKLFPEVRKPFLILTQIPKTKKEKADKFNNVTKSHFLHDKHTISTVKRQ